jgi:hypothetical protein
VETNDAREVIMKVQQWITAAALALAVPALASAQAGTTSSQDPASTTGQTGATTAGETNTSTGTTTTTGTNTTTAGTTADSTTGTTAGTASTTAQQGNTTTNMYETDAPSHWTASGFVGSHFGDSVEGSQFDFGGSLGYMWRGAFGAEFLAGFSPDFQFANNVLGGAEPQVNTYMGNLMGAIPLGFDAAWQPFVSGGLGAITMRSDITASVDGSDFEDAFGADDTQLGGNIGFGVMGFAGAWGVRGDVRYFRGFNNNDSDNTAGQSILSDLDFWRANIGVAVRW